MMDFFNRATQGRPFEIIESHNLISEYGTVYIFKDSENHYYIGETMFPDRGAPREDYFEISEQDYLIYRNPSKEGIIQLLQKRFFNSTLFDVFLKRKQNEELLKSLVSSYGKQKFNDYSVELWFANQVTLSTQKDSNPEAFATIDFNGFLDGMKFISFDILEVDTREFDETLKSYSAYRITIHLSDQQIISKILLESNDPGHPLFQVGEAYPIKDAWFGSEFQYTAKAPPAPPQNMEGEVSIQRENDIIYKFTYPSRANLGRFLTFLSPDSPINLHNSLVFMYPIRDHNFRDTCFIFRYELNGNNVELKSTATSMCPSYMAFSPKGILATGYLSDNRNRPYGIKLYQL